MKSYPSFLLGVLFLLSCSHEMPIEKNGENQLPQWPMFGKNLRHTSNAADPVEYYSGPQQGSMVWSALRNFDGFWCSPSIGKDGTVYVASGSEAIHADSGFIYAVRPDGTVKWTFRTQRPNYSTGALGQDGTYFYGSSDMNLYAIDQDGNLKWKRTLGYFDTEARPAISKTGEVIVSVGSGVTALNAETGDIIWSYQTDKPLRHGFAVSIDQNGTIYTGTESSILALASDGSKKWEFPVSYGPSEVIIAHDGTLYFQLLSDSLFYALNPDGSLRWAINLQAQAGNNSPCIGADGSVYVINSDRLFKLNPKGFIERKIELADIIQSQTLSLYNSAPIIDNDHTVYLAINHTGRENFYAINESSLKWRITIDNPGVAIFPKPAIAPDGTLYVAGDFTLNAIR